MLLMRKAHIGGNTAFYANLNPLCTDNILSLTHLWHSFVITGSILSVASIINVFTFAFLPLILSSYEQLLDSIFFKIWINFISLFTVKSLVCQSPYFLFNKLYRNIVSFGVGCGQSFRNAWTRTRATRRVPADYKVYLALPCRIWNSLSTETVCLYWHT